MRGGWCAETAWRTMHDAVEPIGGPGSALLAAGAVGVAGAAGAWLWRRRALVAAAMFTRLSREDVREHPTRARLLDEAKRVPGLSTAELARALAANEGTVLYHLRVLERTGALKSLATGRERRWFEATAPPSATPPASRRRVLAEVEARPGATLTEVANRLGLAKSTTHHHLAPLVKEGRVATRREGRVLRLYPGERGG